MPRPDTLPPPPLPDLDHASLFLDFDGTLVELAPTPDRIHVDDALLARVDALAARMPDRVAIVSGRSIAQLDGFLGARASMLAIAGSHGAEERRGGGATIAPVRSSALDAAARALHDYAEAQALHFEDKSLGAALHFGADPSQGADAEAEAERIANEHGLVLQRGKMMIEVRASGDKGAALAAMMARGPMAGTIPWYVGDDVTDEDGFAAARRLGGHGILIGPARDTAADFRLDDVAALHRWLDEALA